MSSTLDEAYWTGRHYPGGIEALAARLGRPNLSDELNPNRPTAKLGVGTLEDMMNMSGDYRALRAMCRATGHYPPLRMPEFTDAGEPCIQQIGKLTERFAALVGEVSAAVVDGVVTDEEASRVHRALAALDECEAQLIHHVTALNAKARARAPKADDEGRR